MSCPQGKDSFPSRGVAKSSAARTQRRNRATGKTTHRMDAYHCRECGTWHVTGFNT